MCLGTIVLYSTNEECLRNKNNLIFLYVVEGNRIQMADCVLKIIKSVQLCKKHVQLIGGTELM